MPPHFPNDHDNERHVGRPFHRHKSIHRLFGGGKAADILLWKNKNLSAGVLAGATLIWFLFDVVEYNMIPLLSQIAIFAMLVIFIWSNAAPLFDRAPPRIPEVIISEHAFREIALNIHYKLAYAASLLYDIGCGKDLNSQEIPLAPAPAPASMINTEEPRELETNRIRHIALLSPMLSQIVLGSLMILSVIGGSCSLTSLLYLGFLCVHTLPVMYQQYETEVDHLVARGREDIKKFYKKIDTNVLNRIPRGPVKTKLR